MSTLLEALSDGSYDMQNKRDLSTGFSRKLIDYRNVVVSEYLKYKIDLSKAISNIAKRENLNDDQIQRIVEEVNNQVYLHEYEKLKGQPDREVQFNIASVDNVKKYIRGDIKDEEVDNKNNSESKEKNTYNKVAFEREKIDCIEKVASSSNEKRDIFNGMLDHTFGDLSVKNKVSREDFLINKIATTIKDKSDSIEKKAKEVSGYASFLGEVFVNLEKFGCNIPEISSAMVKAAKLEDKEFSLVKEAASKKTADLIERRSLPDCFEINWGELNLEKTSSEKFSIGKYSLNKTAEVHCGEKIPQILLSNNSLVNSFEGIVKIASELKNCIGELEKMNCEYVNLREKCASNNLSYNEDDGEIFFLEKANEEELEKDAGSIDDSISKLTKLMGNATNSAKGSGFISNLTGATKRVAKDKLDDSVKVYNSAIDNPVFKELNKKGKDLTNKAVNLDKELPINKKINDARNNLNYFKQSNKTVLDRRENQGFVKNLFDRQSRKASKEVNRMQGDIDKMRKTKVKQKESILSDLYNQKDKVDADISKWKTDNNIPHYEKNISNAQDAYDKAVRKTRNTRVGTAIAGTGGIVGVKKIKDDKREKVNYSNDLNNSNIPYYPYLNNDF